jgi:glycosyltransferase involved in cell wall biosynthesis
VVIDHFGFDWRRLARLIHRRSGAGLRNEFGEWVGLTDRSDSDVGARPSSLSPAVKVLLVADARSPTTCGWVDAIRSAGVIVLGADGLPWPEQLSISVSGERSGSEVRQWLRSLAGATPRGLKLAGSVRRVVGPFLTPVKGYRIRRIVKRVKPDLVHGLRIPYEAMAAVIACPPATPLAVSIWGNDLTHEASRGRWSKRATRGVLARADLLFADCERDISLAGKWGLRLSAQSAVLPGGGGIDLTRMTEVDRTPPSPFAELLGCDHRLVVNARGSRPYVRNEILLEALTQVATHLDPRVRVVFVDSVHDVALRRSIALHRLAERIIVMGKLSHEEILLLFREAEVSVSITDQDGTPNTLLEAMAAGVIPVCSDLPSIREWIEPGRNGFLAPFDDPQALADVLRLALSLSEAERTMIRKQNDQIIAERAERSLTGMRAAEKYRTAIMSPETKQFPLSRSS